ncbi:integrase [Aphanothece hegewaldii CCALA 016]|uniref:Integrase n=1 Tax=Aphanothece hegewaldii CCALA 016 TaxID=2107694 RepID=A0A2T1LRE5_9CHRO|nr:tyrosine-type recombinase/integrase [Aphanothece hegewaldii]PSF31180.1 integrase [Aphanothece hegewaldii CCALA 016]
MPDIKLGTDKGILRLQFSSRVSQAYYGRRQFYKGLGRSDTPSDREWALSICRRIQLDIDHPDDLFDPTLIKYLGFKTKSVEAIGSGIKLGQLYEDYVNWKVFTGKISETTLKTRHNRTYLNWLKPFLEEEISPELVSTIAKRLLAQNFYKPNLKKFFSALSEMGDRAVRKEILPKNYFFELKEIDLRISKKSHQLAEEEDYRNFTLEERDLIISCFRNSSRKNILQISDLIEFLFLTGCRQGEAFALKWNDIKDEWIMFDESYSSETKITKEPKNRVVRIFKTKRYDKLNHLIHNLRSKRKKINPNDYVFLTANGKQYNRFNIQTAWQSKNTGNSEGIVTQLAREGKISQYLKPSSTRHTFITLQAQAGVDLKLLADSCGNSVDTIYDHYLGANRNAVFINM